MSDVGDNLVLLVRHPQTEANVERRYMGTRESPYTETGELQAATLVDALTAWGPDRTYSSPRKRTLDVARLVAGEDALEVLDDIAEIDFGCAEGMTADEMEAAGLRVDYPGMPELAGRRLCGESWDSFQARTARAAERFGSGTGRTLVVTHGGVMRALLAGWFDLTPRGMYRLEVANAGHALVAIRDGRPRLRSFGPDIRVLER